MIWGFGWHRMHSHTDETGLRDTGIGRGSVQFGGSRSE